MCNNKCKIDGCNEVATDKGFCTNHVKELNKLFSSNSSVQDKCRVAKKCLATDCNLEATEEDGFCLTHHMMEKEINKNLYQLLNYSLYSLDDEARNLSININNIFNSFKFPTECEVRKDLGNLTDDQFNAMKALLLGDILNTLNPTLPGSYEYSKLLLCWTDYDHLVTFLGLQQLNNQSIEVLVRMFIGGDVNLRNLLCNEETKSNLVNLISLCEKLYLVLRRDTTQCCNNSTLKSLLNIINGEYSK